MTQNPFTPCQILSIPEIDSLELVMSALGFYFLWTGKIVAFLLVVITWLLMIIHGWFG